MGAFTPVQPTSKAALPPHATAVKMQPRTGSEAASVPPSDDPSEKWVSAGVKSGDAAPAALTSEIDELKAQLARYKEMAESSARSADGTAIGAYEPLAVEAGGAEVEVSQERAVESASEASPQPSLERSGDTPGTDAFRQLASASADSFCTVEMQKLFKAMSNVCVYS